MVAVIVDELSILEVLKVESSLEEESFLRKLESGELSRFKGLELSLRFKGELSLL